MRRRRSVLALAALLVAAPAIPAPIAAQELPASDFLIINQERILTGSRAGQRLLEAEEAERDRLRTEARGIDSAFEAEERRLTEQRPTLPLEKFRALADDFDRRVVAARREQDKRSEALAQDFDRRRRQFYASVAPILVKLMDRYRAKAIFDENSVLLADQQLNITATVIAEIDASADAAPTAPAEDAPPENAAPAQEDGGN